MVEARVSDRGLCHRHLRERKHGGRSLWCGRKSVGSRRGKEVDRRERQTQRRVCRRNSADAQRRSLFIDGRLGCGAMEEGRAEEAEGQAGGDGSS